LITLRIYNSYYKEVVEMLGKLMQIENQIVGSHLNLTLKR